jgi:ribose 5-phosphate isomerase B
MARIAIGSDEAAYELKTILIRFLEDEGYEVDDFGTYDNKPVLYPDIAYTVAKQVAEKRFERAVLLCGTGIGVAITANKVPGVRAAQCHDTYSAERARKSNNAQIITMGSRVVGPELAKSILAAWLRSEYSGGASAAKVDRICEYEEIIARDSAQTPEAAEPQLESKGTKHNL